MHILFDGQQLTEQMTGVGYFSDRVVRHMIQLDSDHQWTLLCSQINNHYVEKIASTSAQARPLVLNEPVPLDYRVQHQLLSQIYQDHPFDLYFSPSFLSAPKEVARTISCVHDATYVLYPECYPKGVASYLHKCVENTCNNAWRIVTMSENSRRDIHRFYHYPQEDIHAIALAADKEFFQTPTPAQIAHIKQKYSLPAGYILAVNMGSPKKNIKTLFAAYQRIARELRSEVKLVIVGEWSAGAQDIPQLAREAGIEENVILTGFVPREDLSALYSAALVFCFPSLHEGFGLPVVEAMASGVPVISSNRASLPEVAADAAKLLDAEDTAGWTREIEQLISSPTERQRLIAKGRERAQSFSWEKTANSILAVVNSCSPRIEVVESNVASPAFSPVALSGLACTFTVDDIRPEPGFGGNRQNGPLQFLMRLYEEFGCKATLFVPTNWQGFWPLDQYLDWFEWLVAQPCFEIACHGHLHAIAPGSPDPGEFRGISPQKLEEIIETSLAIFAKVGHKPLGIRAPGWFLEPDAYAVFDKHFLYVADHVESTQSQRLENAKLLRFPYLYSVDETDEWPEEGLVVLQSHIAMHGRTRNGWRADIYERMRFFMRTGKRLQARFLTLGELAQQLNDGLAAQPTAEPITIHDQRLYGGEVKYICEQAGVLYNASGARCPLKLQPENATIAIISKNRQQYLADLLDSIDRTGPKELARVVILNNCNDHSRQMIEKDFPNWRIVEVTNSDDHRSRGIDWIKDHLPELWQGIENKEWPAASSIGWLRNQQLIACERDFLLSFDDDYIVKPGWWQYYTAFQHKYEAHGVFNNFGAFVMCKTIPEKIGWFDERFAGSHGYEDTDYAARISEAKIRWVLGFNKDHDWRSAEEGNPRGSMTGSDLFIHRYAFMAGGFSARREEFSDHRRAVWNKIWFESKWQYTTEKTGIIDRPPFKGKFLKRKIHAEPVWPELPRREKKMQFAGVKTKENTPVVEIDPIANPATGTMVDRYMFACHWCKGKRVIDAACGFGYGSMILLALGAKEVVGVDIEPEGLEYAQKYFSNDKISFQVFDLVAEASPLAKFDVAVSIETMEHLPYGVVEKYLQSLLKHTAIGGTIFITTPRRTIPEWHYRGGTHRYEYSIAEFEELITKTFPFSQKSFLSIEEFRLDDEPRLYSRLRPGIDDRSRIMIGVIENLCVEDLENIEKTATKTLLIVIGTGRCGTTSMSEALSLQQDCSFTHEGLPLLPWVIDLEMFHHKIRGILNREGVFVGDSGFYYLPYVEELIREYPNVKIVCLKRPKEETVSSFLQWTTPNHRWLNHDGSYFVRDQFDFCFPKYNIEDKRQACAHYWEEYYKTAEELERKYPGKIKIYDTYEALNTEKGLTDVLSFAGFGAEKQKVQLNIQLKPNE